jgi:hypothetical protein
MITALGWLATALVIASYAQASVTRLRRLSLVASVLLIVFNAALGIWSNVALEVALVMINLVRLLTSRDEEAATSPELDDSPAPDTRYTFSA